jgi:hypothetical protein
MALLDHRYPITDLGVTTWAPLPPIEDAIRVMEKGLHYGYPLCCIEEYAIDMLEGRHPAMRRGTLSTGTGDGLYVPCSQCCREIGRDIPA